MINFLTASDFPREESSNGQQSIIQFLETLQEGFKFVHVQGSEVRNKESFLHAFSRALAFPEYFGNNWDAFEECINDLSWLEFRSIIIFFSDVDAFAQFSNKDFDVAMSMLIGASNYWKTHGRPLHIFVTWRDFPANSRYWHSNDVWWHGTFISQEIPNGVN